ncbi:hypothetical protein [Campylobacter hyointestinalis]|uniref:hypothetical protein n=1 Tax=Campylobacter hyointestinalis TaxID=198 RepID=UPI000DCDC562|nr:hypothetical protein [Campylobacter hyointestinalis]RAZ50571.1 hypothetical protein CHL9004_01025 [Campylobacter hyointestinalis subsp. lawsonii]
MVASLICPPVNSYSSYQFALYRRAYYRGVDFTDSYFNGYMIRKTFSLPPNVSLDEIIDFISFDRFADYHNGKKESLSDIHNRLSDKVFGDEVFLEIKNSSIKLETLSDVYSFTDYSSVINEWEVVDVIEDSYNVQIPPFSGYVKLSDVYSFVFNYINPYFERSIDFVTSNYKFEPYTYVEKLIFWGDSTVVKFPPNIIQDYLLCDIEINAYITYPTLELRC